MSVSESQLASLLCLVVDDEPSARDLLTATLMTVGVRRVISASSGSEAFDMLAASPRPIDIVLSDIRMPNGNGLQLLQALRTGKIKTMRLNATFVLTTALPTPDTVKVASALDANGYVVKPFIPAKLEASLLKARRTVFPALPARYIQVTVPADL